MPDRLPLPPTPTHSCCGHHQVFTLGGSVTKGQGSHAVGAGYAERFFEFINATWPHRWVGWGGVGWWGGWMRGGLGGPEWQMQAVCRHSCGRGCCARTAHFLPGQAIQP